jgi:hypothetical protein
MQTLDYFGEIGFLIFSEQSSSHISPCACCVRILTNETTQSSFDYSRNNDYLSF